MATESKAFLSATVTLAVTATAVYASITFVASGPPSLSTAVSQAHFLGTSAHRGTPSPAETFGTVAACTSFAAGLVAGIVTVGRRAVFRRFGGAPVGEHKQQPEFAGGLVGCEHGGYGRHEFDPAGLASRWPEHLPWFREAEQKHGRVAMLACLGLIVPDAIRIPLDTFESADLNVINAHNKLIGPGLGDGPMWWLLIFCAAIESTRFKQLGLAYENLTLDNAGDVGFGKGFLPKSKEGIIAMQIKELKNGRLAMLGFSGAITQAVIYDSPHFPFVPN